MLLVGRLFGFVLSLCLGLGFVTWFAACCVVNCVDLWLFDSVGCCCLACL